MRRKKSVAIKKKNHTVYVLNNSQRENQVILSHHDRVFRLNAQLHVVPALVYIIYIGEKTNEQIFPRRQSGRKDPFQERCTYRSRASSYSSIFLFASLV